MIVKIYAILVIHIYIYIYIYIVVLVVHLFLFIGFQKEDILKQKFIKHKWEILNKLILKIEHITFLMT